LRGKPSPVVYAALSSALAGLAVWLGMVRHSSDAATLAGTFAALLAMLAVDTADRTTGWAQRAISAMRPTAFPLALPAATGARFGG